MKNYQNSEISQQKMNTFLENKVFFNHFFPQNFISKSWSPSLIFFKEKILGQILLIFDLKK
jgi:hypothetical protein